MNERATILAGSTTATDARGEATPEAPVARVAAKLRVRTGVRAGYAEVQAEPVAAN